MPDATDRRFLVKITVVMAALVALVAAVTFGWRPVLIAYHRHRMRSSFVKAVRTPASDRRQGEYIGRYEAGRDALVRLGYLEHREFRLEYVAVPSDASKAFWTLVLATFPGNTHTQLQGYEPGMPDALVVWDRPENMPTWEKFVKTHDVPDFMERFGDEAEEARQEFLQSRTVP